MELANIVSPDFYSLIENPTKFSSITQQGTNTTESIIPTRLAVAYTALSYYSPFYMPLSTAYGTENCIFFYVSCGAGPESSNSTPTIVINKARTNMTNDLPITDGQVAVFIRYGDMWTYVRVVNWVGIPIDPNSINVRPLVLDFFNTPYVNQGGFPDGDCETPSEPPVRYVILNDLGIFYMPAYDEFGENVYFYPSAGCEDPAIPKTTTVSCARTNLKENIVVEKGKISIFKSDSKNEWWTFIGIVDFKDLFSTLNTQPLMSVIPDVLKTRIPVAYIHFRWTSESTYLQLPEASPATRGCIGIPSYIPNHIRFYNVKGGAYNTWYSPFYMTDPANYRLNTYIYVACGDCEGNIHKAMIISKQNTNLKEDIVITSHQIAIFQVQLTPTPIWIYIGVTTYQAVGNICP